MAVATGKLTYDDLCRAREDGNRYELIEGELVVIAGPSPKHQLASHRLAVACDRAVVGPGLGFVFSAPLDVRLGDSYVQPDLMVVFNERVGIIGETLIDGAPDLVMEIASSSSRSADRTTKLALYARSGVREYWFVDERGRIVTLHADPVGERFGRIEQPDRVARSSIVPGLEVDVAALFVGLPGRR